ncbi:hypothetical protein GH714_029742 [Hevea brasiliensis]|uniref:Uncharacterized protein n=1 Tax=Hevea brasiliensis TaxID=3981 RepID=A0A6A6L2P5_HEVBR|nr:hypothetical protein GH714_029742 [Hevea brasiliensis]
MERSRGEGYDPCRIPSAIFETNKTKPVEWSNASNESLFSLQLGTSFSRDRLLSMEFSKPGEVEFQFSPSPSVPVADTENRISVANRPSIPMEETKEETTETKKSESCVADGTTSKDATKPDEKRSVHVSLATVLIVAGHSAIVPGQDSTVPGQAATVPIVAVRSATV